MCQLSGTILLEKHESILRQIEITSNGYFLSLYFNLPEIEIVRGHAESQFTIAWNEQSVNLAF